MEIWLNEISMFGSTRVVWLNIYHKKGKGITLLPHFCPFPKSATPPMRFLS